MSYFSTIFCRFFWIFFISGAFTALASGQNSTTDRYDISLLTCGPGQDLYSIFGHSALRVRDQVSGNDLVYNYGVFDFDEPGFMWKFLRGKLRYKLGINRYDRFAAAYQREGRSVTENALLLSPDQEQDLIKALQINYLPENRYYLYDFYYDNCATRIRDIIEQTVDSVHTGYGPFQRSSYRKTLDLFTCPAFPWTDLGMDLILGRNTEVKCDARGSMYLPDYLQLHLENYRQGDGPLLGPRSTIIAQRKVNKANYFTHPLFIFGLLYLVFGLLSKRYPHRKIWNTIDAVILILFSLIGCVFLFMHFGTDQTSTRWNMNILWALPILFLAIFKFRAIKFWRYFAIYSFFVTLSVTVLLQGGPLSLSFLALIPGIIGLRRGWWRQGRESWVFSWKNPLK